MVPRPHPSIGRPTRVRYWVIVFAVALAVITYIDRVCISFAAPAIREDLHLNTKQLGWVFLSSTGRTLRLKFQGASWVIALDREKS